MAELDDLDTRARLAVLDVMGWPDDRNHPGTEDGVPPAAHWTLAGELVAAVAPLLRRQVAEELSRRLVGDERHLDESLPPYERWLALGRSHFGVEILQLVSAPDHTTTDQGGPDGSR